MNKLMVAVFAGMVTLAGFSAQAATPEQECQKLQDDYNLIYASKGFCFISQNSLIKSSNV